MATSSECYVNDTECIEWNHDDARKDRVPNDFKANEIKLRIHAHVNKNSQQMDMD